MMDFIDIVINHLETNLNLFATFKVDILSEDDMALTIRSTPSSPSDRFMDKGKDDIVAFQILVKHTDQMTAIRVINEIKNKLDQIDPINLQSQNGSYEFVKCEVNTNPTLVTIDDRNCFIYTALFNATLFV